MMDSWGSCFVHVPKSIKVLTLSHFDVVEKNLAKQ